MRPMEELRAETALRIMSQGMDGFVGTIDACGTRFRIIVSTGGGWDHASVSLPNRCPTWEEMCAVKRMVFTDEERVVQFHPPRAEYVSVHPFCLHLWRWQEGEFPHPPSVFVGPRTDDEYIAGRRLRANMMRLQRLTTR